MERAIIRSLSVAALALAVGLGAARSSYADEAVDEAFNERLRALEAELRQERSRNDAQQDRIRELELTIESLLAGRGAGAPPSEIERAVDDYLAKRAGAPAPVPAEPRDERFSIRSYGRFVVRFFGAGDISTDQSVELEHLVVDFRVDLTDAFTMHFVPGVSHDGNIALIELYGDYRFDPRFEIRAGRFIIPFSGIHAWAYPSDSFLEPYLAENSPRPFLYGPWWDEGVMASGRFVFGAEDQHAVGYHLYAINGFDRLGLDGVHKRTIGDNNRHKTVGGRVTLDVRLGDETQLSFGVSGLTGTYDIDDDLHFYAIEGDVELATGPFRLYLEVFHRPAEVEAAVVEAPTSTLVRVTRLSGVKLRPEVRIGSSTTIFAQLDYLTVHQAPRTAGRWSLADASREDFVVKTGLVGVRFDLTRHLSLRVEGGVFARDRDLGDDIEFFAVNWFYSF